MKYKGHKIIEGNSIIKLKNNSVTLILKINEKMHYSGFCFESEHMLNENLSFIKKGLESLNKSAFEKVKEIANLKTR